MFLSYFYYRKVLRNQDISTTPNSNKNTTQKIILKIELQKRNIQQYTTRNSTQADAPKV